jgi:hypothetical protein
MPFVAMYVHHSFGHAALHEYTTDAHSRRWGEFPLREDQFREGGLSALMRSDEWQGLPALFSGSG